MRSFDLLIEAVRLLTQNFKMALRISLLPWAFVFFGTILLIYWVTGQLTLNVVYDNSDPSSSTYTGNGLPNGFWLTMLGVPIASLIIMAWIAIAWHRFGLLNETTKGVLPPINGWLLPGYIGRTLLIGLVGMGYVLIYMVLILWLLPKLFVYTFIPIAFYDILQILGGIVLAYLITRISLVLPAGVVGREMSIGDSWEFTREFRAEVFIATSAIMVLQEINVWLTTAFSSQMVLEFGISFVGGWVLLMLGISILTLLYRNAFPTQPVL